MMALFLTVGVVCSFFGVYSAAVVKRACPSAYLAISPNHTMCFTDVGVQITLTSAEIQAAVNEHNKHRRLVSPTASDMQKVVWDTNLAIVASKWAAQCKIGHDSHREEPTLPGVWIGQNMAAGYLTLADAIKAWQSEIQYFRYGSSPTGVVGHYTQIVNAETARVGCGVANCSASVYSRFQVCNYALGQFGSAESTPYTKGTSCSGCSTKCDSSGKLCDCGGKVCVNNGYLNITTCQCDCPAIYTGNICQTLNCIPDQSYCPLYVRYYGNDVCKRYYNVPEECPYMCGLCS